MKAKKTFTVHTELIDGTLDGARNIYMGANSTCHLYVIPREEISLANTIEDIVGQPAFYILMGDSCSSRPQAYIGHTTDFANRKNDHVQKKDFWKTALVFVSDNHKIYGDDVKFLEYLGIKEALSADSHELLNGNNPKRPNIAPFRVNDMEVFFRDILFLARFYGCNVFDIPEKEHVEERHFFFVHTEDRPCSGKAYFDDIENKLVLIKGSILAADTVPSFKPTASRNKFIEEHCTKVEGQITLCEDVPFDSPSGASGFVMGRPSNGWDDWKDKEGKKLGEIIKR